MSSPIPWIQHAWRRPRFRFWAIFFLVILVIRLCLAFVIKTGANEVLKHMHRYSGHIDHVGLSFWRGAYQFKGVKVATLDGKVPLPLFQARSVDIAVQWRAMLRGEWLASVVLVEPTLNFVSGPDEGKSQYGIEQDWLEVIQQLVILKVNRLELHRGQVHFADPYQDPPLDMHLDGVEARLEGMREHRYKDDRGLPCTVSISAQLMGQAPLSITASVDAFATEPTFDYSISLVELDLSRLDLLFSRYLGVKVAGGRLSVYSEGISDAGLFKGYVKPLVKGLRVLRTDDKASPKLVKKFFVWALAWVIKDHFHDQNATKIPLTGDLRGGKTTMHAHWFTAVLSWLGNASVDQQKARLDNEVDLHTFKKPEFAPEPAKIPSL